MLRLSLILIPTSVPPSVKTTKRLVSTGGQSANSTVPIYSKYMKTSGKRAKHAGKGFRARVNRNPVSNVARIINISNLIFFFFHRILEKSYRYTLYPPFFLILERNSLNFLSLNTV